MNGHSEPALASEGLKPALLTNAQRAVLFRALGRLEDSGIPVNRAVAAMADLLGSGHAHRFRSMSTAIGEGASLTEAGSRFGLFSARDRKLIRLAERSGSLARAAVLLAHAYDNRARAFAALRSRMLLPLFVLVLGSVLLPLPAFLAGHMGAGNFLWRASTPIAGLALAAGLVTWLLRRAAAQGLSPSSGRWLLRIPVLSQALVQVSRLQLMEGLILLLHAGVPVEEALQGALDSLTNPAARRHYAAALPLLEQTGLSGALRSAGVLEADEFAVASSSEQGGRLVEGLEWVAGKLRSGSKNRLDLLSEWLPRAVYLLVVAVLAAGLLG